ncbi:MAG: SMC-Scp complex subunit ScpB [Chromatiales bacterium]
MNEAKVKNIIEAALLVAHEPLSIDRLADLFALDLESAPDRALIRRTLASLEQEYQGRGMQLIEVASGYRLQTRADLAPWLNRLWEDRPQRYSRALLETLAIIAYRQPITRGEIEDIRGVSISPSIMKTLTEREWIRIVGHRDVPGRPAVYATTRQFLDYFNLKSVGDLPSLAELRDIDDINLDLFGDTVQQPASMTAQMLSADENGDVAETENGRGQSVESRPAALAEK